MKPRKKSTGPAKAIDLHSMPERDLNNLFIQSTGARKHVRRALEKQMTGKEISQETLCSYWRDIMQSQMGVNVGPSDFPGGPERPVGTSAL